MENRAHALIAGLFTLLLAVAAVGALWWFGGKNEVTDEYLVETTKNVTGLNPQAQVRYRGVRVGRVVSVELDPADVSRTLIHISIRQGIPITETTVAKLGYQGVTGIAHILLEETEKDSPRIVSKNGALARIPMQDSLIQELSDAGAEALRNARDVLDNANELLNEQNRQKISRMLANLEATSGNARDASAQLKALLTPENVERLNATLVHAEHTAKQAGPFFAEARGLVAKLQGVSDKLDRTLGDPPAGGSNALAPRLSDLAGELTTTSRELSRVLRVLEESPQSLVFGHQRAPGPGEAGFVAPGPQKETP